jgi:hypothetical protein
MESKTASAGTHNEGMSMAAATANWKLAESADASSIAKPNAVLLEDYMYRTSIGCGIPSHHTPFCVLPVGDGG